MTDEPRRVNLALQGGGSHGAFTWGVLDALLEDGRLEFEGITGASAGAINAVLVASGWCKGLAAGQDPRAAARESMRDFWQALGAQPGAFSWLPAWGRDMRTALANPMFLWLDVVSRLWSPYQFNPFNLNPLSAMLARRIEFDRLRATCPFKLFVCATNVRTGRPRIFRERELKLDMVLASSCLPFAFQAVAVTGENGIDHYWDGGYMGNPALWPLFYATRSSDLLLVQINPLRRDDLPDTAQEIAERTAEISFNASLLHEMRAIDFVQRLLNENKLDPQRYKRVRMHMIDAEEKMSAYGASSKYNTSSRFLTELFDVGRSAATEWLDAKFEYVGHASSVTISERFL